MRTEEEIDAAATPGSPFSNGTERFWSKVDASGVCMEWTGSLRGNGYGQFRHPDGRVVKAHRFAWEDIIGPIPEGFEPDHRCRNRRCVDTSHMELVTHKVNVLRGSAPSATAARRTHCPQGHPYDAANTIVRRHGKRLGRECRTCVRAQQAVRNKRYAQRHIGRSR